tara:strand:+ start:2309 stop:3115 length:807 start_codon:yes stop_codon:yes gene_type:complete
MITTNFLPPLVDIEISQNKFHLSQLTTEYNEGDSITTATSIDCRKLALALKAGDKITINGTALTIYADAAVDATSFFVEAITLDEALDLDANIDIDENNMFVQYQRKTEGTIGGMPVTTNSLGPITDTAGVYDIIGVDPTYVKILPRDFMINEDGAYEALEFKDSANSGLQVGDAAQEMVATVNIPYGTSATEVAIWGSNTGKTVEVYECNVNANGIGTEIGTGVTDGAAIELDEAIPSTSTNYLLILVKVTATSNRIYGGKVTLTQN